MSKLSNLKNIPFKARVVAVAVGAAVFGGGYYTYKSFTTHLDSNLNNVPHTNASLDIDLKSSNNIKRSLPGHDVKLLNSQKIQDTYKNIENQKLESAQKEGKSYVSQLTYQKSRDLISYLDYMKTQGTDASFSLALKWMGPANPTDYYDFTKWVAKQENNQPSFHNYTLWLKVERPAIFEKYSAWTQLNNMEITFKSYMSWLAYITNLSDIKDFANFLHWSSQNGRTPEFSDLQEWLANADPATFNAYQKWLKAHGLKPSWESYSKFLKENKPKEYSAYQKWLKANGLDDNYDNYTKFLAEANRLKNGTSVSDYANWLKKNGIKPSDASDAITNPSALLQATSPELYNRYQRWLDMHGLADTPENYKQFLASIANDADQQANHKKIMEMLKNQDPEAYNKYQRWLKEHGLTDSPEAYKEFLDSIKNSDIDPIALHKQMIEKLKSSDPEAYKAYQAFLKANGLTDSPEAYQKWLKQKAIDEAKEAHKNFMKDLLASNPDIYNAYQKWLKDNGLADSPEAYAQFMASHKKDEAAKLAHKEMINALKTSNPSLYNAYQKWLKDNGLTDSPEAYQKFLDSMHYDPVTTNDLHKKAMTELLKNDPETYNAYQKWLKENGLTDSADAYAKFVASRKANASKPYHDAYLAYLQQYNPAKYNDYKAWLAKNGLPDSSESLEKMQTEEGVDKATAAALHKAFIDSLKKSDPAKYKAYQEWLRANNLSDSPEAYQKFLDSLAPSHASYMKWLKDADPEAYKAYQKWLKDNGLTDSEDAYQKFLAATNPKQAEAYKKWLEDNGLTDSYENYQKFLASQDDAMKSILGDHNVCSTTSLKIFADTMYATNQEPSYKNFRSWMREKSSCRDSDYQNYLQNEGKVDSFSTYESYLDQVEPDSTSKYESWITLQGLTSSWTNYLWWNLQNTGMSASDISALIGTNTSNFLKSLDCHVPTYVQYSKWASENDGIFKDFIAESSKLGIKATFPNLIKFYQSTYPGDYSDFSGWLNINTKPMTFQSFIEWKAETEVAGDNQCSITAIKNAGNISAYLDYLQTNGLGMDMDSFEKYLADQDPATLSAYKQWLKDHGLEDNEQNYLKFLSQKNPAEYSEYQKWLKEHGLKPSLKTLAMFKAEKEGVNPDNSVLKRLIRDIQADQRKAWKEISKNAIPSLEKLKSMIADTPSSHNSHVTISSNGDIDYAKLNKDLALEHAMLNNPSFNRDEYLRHEMQNASGNYSSMSDAVKEAAELNPTISSIVSNDLAGNNTSSSTFNSFSGNSVTGNSRYDKYFRDHTPNYANLDAVKHVQQYAEQQGNNGAYSEGNSEVGSSTTAAYPTDYVQQAVSKTRINAGTILYSNLVIGVNTDEVSRVKSVIVEDGPLKDAVLLGEPSLSGQYGKTVLIHYTKLILNGQEYKVDAYAVDPTTMRTALHGDVDNHIFERYSKLGIAAFMSGYADALSSRSDSTHTDGSKESSTQAIPKVKDRLAYAGGKMMNAFIPFFSQGFDRPATVSISPNTPIGVMFMSGFNINNK